MNRKEIPLEPDNFYHIYNRGNNSQNIFFGPDNYQYFLRQFSEYLSPYLDVFAYCLLPNHFHFLVRIKSVEEINDALAGNKGATFSKGGTFNHPQHVSEAFRRFFTSYSMAINKQQKRHGSLFEKPFRRKHVANTQYLANLVFYIHANPQLHGIAPDFRMYPWSSFERILQHTPTRLQKQQVLQWFSSPENYVAYHHRQANLAAIKELMIE